MSDMPVLLLLPWGLYNVTANKAGRLSTSADELHNNSHALLSWLMLVHADVSMQYDMPFNSGVYRCVLAAYCPKQGQVIYSGVYRCCVLAAYCLKTGQARFHLDQIYLLFALSGSCIPGFSFWYTA